MDRFREPNAFIAVAEAGGFSAAARRTGESRSAIGKVIGVLEKCLDVRSSALPEHRPWPSGDANEMIAAVRSPDPTIASESIATC